MKRQGPAPKLILLDIEGTTTEVSFVHSVLFPYASKQLPLFLATHLHVPEVQACLQDPVLAAVSPAGAPEAYAAVLQQWIAQDRKVTVLKTLQGLIWAEGYAKGDFTSHIYADVAPALARWTSQGVCLGIYSSGSVEAQKQLFQHTPDGDLTPFFSWYFDTKIGGKREPLSYQSIAKTVELDGKEILFLSDVEAELDAAQEVGFSTMQVVRSGTVAGNRHPVVSGFDCL